MRARELKGWTQERLAGEVGTDKRVVSVWESGAKLPRLATFARICDALGADADELLGLEER